MLNSFTQPQLDAVTHHKGPCLVLAGPGSGKTRVITHRVAHLISQRQISPHQILTITFTKKAAIEMQERFLSIMPKSQVWFSTFHACFYQILKHSYPSFPNTFISPKEKQRILQTISNDIFSKKDSIPSSNIEKTLSLYLNHMFQAETIPLHPDITEEHLKVIYEQYVFALKQRNLLDFDILLTDTYSLLKEHTQIRLRWQKQFQYILIDECQDMNLIQYEIVKLLIGEEHNLFMVGDDDQAIYGFRGSNVSLMKRFLEEYAPVKSIHLDVNFRSTQKIVESSQKVIQENQHRFHKMITSCCKENHGVNISAFVYKQDMFEYIVQTFRSAPTGNLSTSAIICRTNAEIRNWGRIMRKEGICYQSGEERLSVFDEEWYLDMEAYIKLGQGSRDISDILRIIHKPERNIYRNQLYQNNGLPDELYDTISKLKRMSPFLAMKYIWNGIGYGKWLERSLCYKKEIFQEISEQYQILLEEAKTYYSIEEWLMYVEEDRQKYRQQSRQKTVHGVHLLTMHSAKGLEFETVYLPNINHGKMPRGFLITEEELEEERRLFYVAMTRAKRNLEICYIKGTEDHKLQPSVFLEPIL